MCAVETTANVSSGNDNRSQLNKDIHIAKQEYAAACSAIIRINLRTMNTRIDHLHAYILNIYNLSQMHAVIQPFDLFINNISIPLRSSTNIMFNALPLVISSLANARPGKKFSSL